MIAANILGQRREADYRAIPRAVYTMPPVFAVGLSPQGAAEAGISVLTGGADLRGTARAAVTGAGAGRVELYAHPESGLLLGAAAVGPHAPDWMGEVTVAIRAGLPLAILADTVHAFPTWSAALSRPSGTWPASSHDRTDAERTYEEWLALSEMDMEKRRTTPLSSSVRSSKPTRTTCRNTRRCRSTRTKPT